METYTLNTTDYDYRILQHEGFGGICKYIATPKKADRPKLLIKHENIQSACNAFMVSRLADLCNVYTPRAYLMSKNGETRRLFPMHPFIVGIEWVENFSPVDYDNVKASPALLQQYLDSMALYAMFCRIADTPQFAYSPSKGIFAYDWDEAFDVTDFIIKLCLYNSETGTEQIKKMLQRISQYTLGKRCGVVLAKRSQTPERQYRCPSTGVYADNEPLFDNIGKANIGTHRCSFWYLSNSVGCLLRRIYQDTSD